MASIDLIRASNGSGDAVKATVTNARVISSTTLQVSAITNFPSKFIATVGSVDGTGAFVPATVTVFNGHTSSGNIEIDSFAPGYTDLGNTPGQIVVLKPTTAWADEVAGVLDVTHNDNGTIKNNAVKTAMLDAANIDASVALKDASITSSKIDFTTLNFGNYSTSEVATEFKWIDGKTIYKKTINFGTLPNATFKDVAHGITGLTAVINTYGYSYSGTTFRPLPFPGSLTNFVGVSLDATNITVTTATNLTTYTTTYITVVYTK